MRRRAALLAVRSVIGDDLVVCNQGGTSQDWHDVRPYNNLYQHAMGLTTTVALGVALALPDERVWAFEGDGGLLMSLGSLGLLARVATPNLRVVVFDNERYESGGGLPTLTAGTVDLEAVARGSGLSSRSTVRDADALRLAAVELASAPAVGFVVAKVEPGTDGPALTIDAVEAKFRFVRDIERKRGIEVIHPPQRYTPII